MGKIITYHIQVQETSYGDYSESTASFESLEIAKNYYRHVVKHYLEMEDEKICRVKIILTKEDSDAPLDILSYISLDFWEGWYK